MALSLQNDRLFASPEESEEYTAVLGPQGRIVVPSERGIAVTTDSAGSDLDLPGIDIHVLPR